MLVGATFARASALEAAGDCQAGVDLATMSTAPIPAHFPGLSYCLWLGVICCISGTYLQTHSFNFKI